MLSPISFSAYADESGHRTYPRQTTHSFHISSSLAALLAEHIGAQDAPAGKLAGENGVATLTIEYLGKDPGDASVFVLVKRAGYRSKAVKIPLAQFLSGGAGTSIVLDKQGKDVSLDSPNPWVVARQLEQQVLFYTREYEKRVYWYLPSLPSLSWAEFEKLVVSASEVAPDYPIVQSSRFFYEVESGRLSEAKKHHRFIRDDIYVRAVYGMNWEKGLRIK